MADLLEMVQKRFEIQHGALGAFEPDDAAAVTAKLEDFRLKPPVEEQLAAGLDLSAYQDVVAFGIQLPVDQQFHFAAALFFAEEPCLDHFGVVVDDGAFFGNEREDVAKNRMGDRAAFPVDDEEPGAVFGVCRLLRYELGGKPIVVTIGRQRFRSALFSQFLHPLHRVLRAVCRD